MMNDDINTTLPTLSSSITNIFIGKSAPYITEGRKTPLLSGYKKNRIESVFISKTGIIGDEHVHKHHGGTERAVNHFPEENYKLISKVYPECIETLKPCGVGENICTQSDGILTARTVCIGDTFRLGNAVVQVSQPRYPCSKVDHYHKKPDIKLYLNANGLSGWFYRVLKEGELNIGDNIELIKREYPLMTIERLQQGMYGNTFSPIKKEEKEEDENDDDENEDEDERNISIETKKEREKELKRKEIEFYKEVCSIELLSYRDWKKVAEKRIKKMTE